ncbi:hypothetical protein SAMN05216474_0433 [Lishizhenia tianjinensis]|uniref:Uncharacterized protein n=1 Tax=Lishizhenia tianjinensis TaxID=477690 RepID=A0A1I6XT37_9FLAO|nr:hypothetical protein [Lishizhenia tianjinensis]SFT41500.1 hypothetical protein SAMN05216474_0433 [Lishizhenia tianjinensis]
MTFIDWLDTFFTHSKRKKVLGEKYTSHLSTRKFTTSELLQLNPKLNKSDIEYIYRIGWCSADEKYLNKIKKCIAKDQLNKISKLSGITYAHDDLGEIPTGNYIQTFLFKLKNGSSFVQLVSASFEEKGATVLYQKEIAIVNVNRLKTRLLIYPI